MCFSAMVEQNAKRYGVRFKARIQLDLYRDIFQRRLDGERIYINKAMEVPFTAASGTAEEREIGRLVTRWHEQQIPPLQKELFAQKKRLSDAERQLETKVTKKAENDSRIARNKIKKLTYDLLGHQSVGVTSENDERIFPLHYLTLLCADESGELVVRPVRYLLRPHSKDPSFDVKFNGCYNARADSLESVPWWSDCFGKRHGLVLVKKFYENVPVKRYAAAYALPEGCEERENFVICFTPDGVDYMFVPALWDLWSRDGEELYSAAIITDDPAPEIARAGHDRSPIFLEESAVTSWLDISGTSRSELRSVLNRRERPSYSHKVLNAA